MCLGSCCVFLISLALRPVILCDTHLQFCSNGPGSSHTVCRLWIPLTTLPSAVWLAESTICTDKDMILAWLPSSVTSLYHFSWYWVGVLALLKVTNEAFFFPLSSSSSFPPFLSLFIFIYLFFYLFTIFLRESEQGRSGGIGRVRIE